MALEMNTLWAKNDYHPIQSNTKQILYHLSKISEEEFELKDAHEEEFERPCIIGTILLPKPVYVTKTDDVEELRYNSAHMKLYKMYKIEWNGKQYGVRKTDTNVEILRFYPDKK